MMLHQVTPVAVLLVMKELNVKLVRFTSIQGKKHHASIYASIWILVCNLHNRYILSLYDSDTNECSSAPCANGGTCNDAVNSYTCSCAPGYNGNLCQTSKLKDQVQLKLRCYKIIRNCLTNLKLLKNKLQMKLTL